RSKGQDASAKSDARNMVSQVESCYSDTQAYNSCTNSTQLGNTGLKIGSATGEVNVPNSGADTFVIVGHSKSGNNFTITKGSDGAVTPTCGTPASGSCLASGTW